MSQSVNKVILIGFLGEAPEVRFSQQGKPVGTFSMAVNESWKDVQGTRRERVEWFRIVCFGRLAEVCGQYLDKGRHIYLEGRLQTQKWSDREGEKRTSVEYVFHNLGRVSDRLPEEHTLILMQVELRRKLRLVAVVEPSRQTLGRGE